MKTYTLQFWLLCFSSYLFFGSFNMIIPELPNYLASMGGEKYLGFIISIFTLTAGLSRPFSGKLADTIGRIPVMVFGAAVCFIVGFIYPVVNTVFAFLFLRLIHGFSTGFKPTGTSAYVGDMVPMEKRGEAMGILGISGSLGMASGPAIGGHLATNYSLETMFYTSSGFAIFSVIILLGMKETVSNKRPFSLSLLKINMDDVFEKRVLPPSLVMMFGSFSFGVMLTIIPDFSEYFGIENKGFFFSIFTLSSVVIRFLAGKASDRFGRVPVLRVSLIFLTFTLIYFGFVDSVPMLTVGSVFIGFSVGMLSPTVFAWTVDLSDPKFRGRGMATMFIALEIGIGLGAFLTGTVYAYTQYFPYVFWMASVFSTIGFIYLLTVNRRKYDLVKN
ncbi:MAG: MFS transporter [Bacteroidota bacterium]